MSSELELAMNDRLLYANYVMTRRHHERGMLSVRDRLALILDPDTPFLELMPLAGYTVKHSSPNASMVCGIGVVQ